jgi:hypothetical protein
MLRVALRGNDRIAAVDKARSVARLGRREVPLGAWVVYCLLFSGIVGKSHLFLLRGYVWKLQMAVVAATVVIGLILSIRRHSLTQTGQDSSELPLCIKTCLMGLLCVSTISCVAQEDVLGNLAYLLVFAGMVYLLWVRGVDLLRGVSGERCMNIALAPLCFMAVSSLMLLPSGAGWASYREELSGVRFKGMYSDSIVAGQMFGLTCLLLFWSLLHTRSRKVWGYWALFLIAILCLVLTRTRTDAMGTAIGMIICLSATMWSHTAAIPRRRARALFAALLLVILSFWLTRPEIDTGSVTEYLRVSGDPDEILRSRLEYWQTGIGNLSITNVLGKGPLAKFGGTLGGPSSQGSGYVRELNAHNSFLSVFQFYGWPGGLLFIVFLIAVGGTFVRRKDPYAILGLSLLAFGFVQCLTENWLLSFGTPLDVYSWFILGITLRHDPLSAVCATNNSRHQMYNR